MFNYPRYGIISKRQLSEDVLNQFLLFSKESTLSFRQKRKNTKIERVFVLPVGHLCKGNCIYCFNNVFMNNQKNTNLMTPEDFIKQMDTIQSNLADSFLLVFSGGSCFLSQYIKEFVNIALRYVKKDKKIKLYVYNDLFLNDEEYLRMLDTLNYIVRNDHIEYCINTMTVDYGLEKSRISMQEKLSNKEVQKRAEFIIDFYKDTKIISQLKTLFTEETNITLFLDICEKYQDEQIYLLFDLVEHNILSPSENKCNEIKKWITEKYNPITFHLNRDFYIENTFLKEMKLKENIFPDVQNIFYQIHDDILLFDNLNIACSAFKNFIAFDNRYFSPCAFMLDYTENFEECITLKQDSKFYPIFSKLNPDCINCVYFYVCNRCPYRVLKNTCDVNFTSKFRVSWSWEMICNHPELMKIVKIY